MTPTSLFSGVLELIASLGSTLRTPGPASGIRLIWTYFDRSLRPIVTLVLGLDIDKGRITGGRVAIGCAYAAPLTVNLPLDEPLLPRELAHHAGRLTQEVTAGLPELLTDHHATSRYRRRIIAVLTHRNLSAAA